ncbi:MAG: phosphate signaling complex protein PhoU [Deltaproteobacteria bacterium]|jgi:phosphate transport system protein|nr:phosphate signaling complex protein PhoU [Deltaproteobacteria bacterium]
MPAVDERLRKIKVKAAEMSSHVVEMYGAAIRAVGAHDLTLGGAVKERDDRVDDLEVELESMCLSMLALHAPKASELRYVAAVLRLICDLERVGDHSAIMASSIFRHDYRPLLDRLPDFDKMAAMAGEMLKDAAESFFTTDPSRYPALCGEDEVIGSLQTGLNRSLVELITKDPSGAIDAVSLINVIRRVERVADHAKNIAALAPYLADGTVVRHGGARVKDADTTD